jgi:hypothetical protein
MIDIDIIIAELSEKYRTGRKNEELLGKEINNIYSQLENKNISHKDYMFLSKQYEEKKAELFKLAKYNDGICDAREIVMNYWEK